MDFDEEFDGFENLNDRFRDMEKEMFKIDASRGGLVALGYDEFVNVFGEPNDEDLFDLSQAYIKLYMKHYDDESIPHIVESYGEKWVSAFLNYNIRIEEYELCAIFKEHLDIYKNKLKIY